MLKGYSLILLLIQKLEKLKTKYQTLEDQFLMLFLIQKAEKFKAKLLSILYIYIYIYICIITSDYNKLTGPMFDTRLKESKLATIKVFTTLGESAIKKQMK